MKFNYTDLDTCHTASGLVIAIDVLRAFSNAAYAFSRGAKEIRLVSTVDEALALRSRLPNARAMGEVGGLPPAGFDFGNSPAQMLEAELRGASLIQRTGAGTQGAVRCVKAEIRLAASYAEAHLDPVRPEFPLSDLDLCTRIDAFNFAMLIQKEQESLIMRAIK